MCGIDMFRKIAIVVALSFLSLPVFANSKTIIRQVEEMTVSQSELIYQARIDTGAVNTSLHAVDIEIIGGSAETMEGNIGKLVEFTTENEQGDQQRLQAEIVKVSTVKNALGTESRYTVKLEVGFADSLQPLYVNLRDRSHMDYKLLIGRNFLKQKYVVDVASKKTIGPVAQLSIKQIGLVYNTRIDTGAGQNSLHAVNIKVENEDTQVMENNIGKMIRFDTENENGETVSFTTRIRGATLIRNAQGSEIRYTVRLSIGEPSKEYFVDVNLTDRSQMGYKLLIGRNWLQGHYVVDMSLPHKSI